MDEFPTRRSPQDVGRLTLHEHGDVSLRWTEGEVSFPIGLKGDAAVDWFAEVTGVAPGGPHDFLWAVRGRVEAPCDMKGWRPLLGLLNAPRPVWGCKPFMAEVDFFDAMRHPDSPVLAGRISLGPVRLSVGEQALWCRDVTVEQCGPIAVVALRPFRGHRLVFKMEALEVAPDGRAFAATTPLGSITVSSEAPDISEISRFPELWEEGDCACVEPPPASVGPVLLAALECDANSATSDPECLEMLVPNGDVWRSRLFARHVVETPDGPYITMLHGDAEDAVLEEAEGGWWMPVVGGALAQVRWYGDMLDPDLIALAAEPAPDWHSMPEALRRKVSDRLLSLIEDELGEIGCLDPWESRFSRLSTERWREHLRRWLELVREAEAEEGRSIHIDAFLEDWGGDSGCDTSLAGAIDLALLLRSEVLPADDFPQPKDVLRVLSWLESRVDHEQWEWDLDAARGRQADDYFDTGSFGSEGDYVYAIRRERWWAIWPALEEEADEDRV